MNSELSMWFVRRGAEGSETINLILNIRERNGYLSAACSDVPGLHLVGLNLEEIRIRAIEAITRLMKKNRGIDVRYAG